MFHALNNPFVASFVAALLTFLFIQIVYQEDKLSKKLKPAVLNAVMVYGIVYLGHKE